MTANDFARNMASLHGEAGREWLAGIPARLRDLERRWSLTVLAPFSNLSYNYVAPCVRDDGTLGFPGDDEAMCEPAALAAFGGRGMARLIEADTGAGAMLIERAFPGTSLVSMEDDADATRILAESMVAIRTPAPANHDFPRVSDWFRGFERLRRCYDGGTGPMPEDLVHLSEMLSSDLLASTDEDSLLHGDLHHDNVLSDGDGWLAIDPKGVVGDAPYECAAMFYNSEGIASRANLHGIFGTRLDILSDVTIYDRECVLGWATAHAVLSAYRELEGRGEVGRDALVVARTLSNLMD